MAKLDLDFQRQSLVRVVPAFLLLGIGVVCAVAAVIWFQQLTQEAGSAEIRLFDVRKMSNRKLTQLEEPLSDSKEVQREIHFANAVLDRITVPWQPLFREIEASSDQTVALLSIQPDSQQRLVRIGGEAKNYSSVLNFIMRLEATQVLEGVHLTSHEVKINDSTRPVQFLLAAAWIEKK